MGATPSRPSATVRLQLSGSGSWGEVPFIRGDTAGTVAARACCLYPRWRDEAPLSLFLVAAGGSEEPSDADVERAAQYLGVGVPLDAVGVHPGAWLVLRPGAGALELHPANNDVVGVPPGDDIDGNFESDGDGDVKSPASPPPVSDAFGPIFESEARASLTSVLRLVCPWLSSHTALITRFEMSFEDESRQADIFCYATGDDFAPCADLPEAGVFVVWPDDGKAVTARPHKYFVGEVYSGEVLRAEKVKQLETEVAFLIRRLADRFAPLAIDDATQVVGAAALVFPVLRGSQRGSQVADALALVRSAAGPHLMRLMAAGRLLLVLLSTDQAPATAHARDTSSVLRNILARQQGNLGTQLKRVSRQIAALATVIEARLPCSMPPESAEE